MALDEKEAEKVASDDLTRKICISDMYIQSTAEL